MQDFDLKIRSMLENAEVQAPPQAWKGIASRLDAAAAAPAHVFSPVWRWTAVALAAAAVVAAGIFLAGTFDRSSEIEDGRVAVVQPESSAETPALLSQALPAEEETAMEQPATVRPAAPVSVRKAPAAPATQAAAPAVAPAAAEKTASQPAPAAVENVPAASVNDAPVAEPGIAAEATHAGTSGPEAAPVPTAGADPFAALEAADAKKSSSAGRPSLYAQGSLGGNDSDLTPAMVPRLRVGGTPGTPASTGVTEKSVSAYGIPLSFGLGMNVPLFDKVSFGTGINLSLLTRTFSGTYNEVSGGVVTRTVDGDVTHSMNYIGVPMNLYFKLVEGSTMKFYVWGGGMVEWCVSNKYRIVGAADDILFSDPVGNPQYSAGIGLGVEFKLSDSLGLYLDPSARYYFPCSQPKNIHTDKPFMVSFEAGLRFNF